MQFQNGFMFTHINTPLLTFFLLKRLFLNPQTPLSSASTCYGWASNYLGNYIGTGGYKKMLLYGSIFMEYHTILEIERWNRMFIEKIMLWSRSVILIYQLSCLLLSHPKKLLKMSKVDISFHGNAACTYYTTKFHLFNPEILEMDRWNKIVFGRKITRLFTYITRTCDV